MIFWDIIKRPVCKRKLYLAIANIMGIQKTGVEQTLQGTSRMIELVDKVLTPKMKKKMGVTDFVLEKMAVEKCLNFDKSVIMKRRSLLC